MSFRMLLGVETEYAIAGLTHAGARVDPAVLAERMLVVARKRRRHLPDSRGSGLFLTNGARLYVDAGAHPEFATPECEDPWEVLRYIRAGELLLQEIAETVRAEEPELAAVTLYRNNVDYSGSGSTWGCHESYLHRCEPKLLPAQLVPHLATRIIYAGAGGFDPLSAGLEFTLSPRACMLRHAVSHESERDRGIFHTKDESLAGPGYHRLHVISGESLCSETSILLKLGTTALVVAAVQIGQRPGDALQLADPLQALRTIAADPGCKAAVQMASGERLTAIDIQRRYLEPIERCAAAGTLPEWAPAICALWRRQLDVLERRAAARGSDGDAPERTLDWAIKHALYTHWGRQQVDPDRWAEWTRILQGLEAVLRGGRREGAPPPLRRSSRRLSLPRFARDALGRCGLSSFVKLRRTLLEADLRFGQLGEGGVFEHLDRGGQLRHRVLGPDDARRALDAPPGTGRARLRAEWVDRLAGSPESGPFVCDWMRIWSQPQNRHLDFSDPFAQEAQWQVWLARGQATTTDPDRGTPASRPETPVVER